MNSILSLPPPPKEMIQEAETEQAEYMNEMLRIALGIKEFRIHVKPILSQKLAENPTGIVMIPRILTAHRFMSKLNITVDTKKHFTKIRRYMLGNVGNKYYHPYPPYTQKADMKIFREMDDITCTTSGKRIEWRSTVCKEIIKEYYQKKHHLLQNKNVSLKKMCALSIAFNMVKGYQRNPGVEIAFIRRWLSSRTIVNYCLKYSSKDIIKNRRSLIGVSNW